MKEHEVLYKLVNAKFSVEDFIDMILSYYEKNGGETFVRTFAISDSEKDMAKYPDRNFSYERIFPKRQVDGYHYKSPAGFICSFQ